MSAMNDGGPAYPFPLIDTGGHKVSAHQGMSLRDWFAGQAVEGFCANPDFTHGKFDDVADSAYAHADAMIVERERRMKGDA